MRTLWRTESLERKKLEEAFLCILVSSGSFGAAEGFGGRFCSDVFYPEVLFLL